MSIAEKLTQIAENVPKVFDAGKKAEYDAFWDVVQDFGNRTDYALGLCGSMFTAETFKPKYSIKPRVANNAFAYWGMSYPKGLIDFRGIDLDLSECTAVHNLFYNNYMVYAVGTIDVRAVNPANGGGYQSMFNGAKNLCIIEKLILTEDVKTFSKTFDYCSSLHTINIDGIIGGSVDFKWSPLSKASITNIFGVLSDSTSGLSVTFSKTSVNTAFGIDVDDQTTYPEGSEYYTLRHSKDNWTVNYI